MALRPSKNWKKCPIGCRGHSGLAGSVAFYYGELWYLCNSCGFWGKKQVLRPSLSATGSIDNSPGGFFLHDDSPSGALLKPDMPMDHRKSCPPALLSDNL